MANQDFLPDNDRDLLLARSLGEALESGSAISSLQDPLIGLLSEYKEAELAGYRSSALSSSSLWDKISAETQKKPRILPLYARPAFRVWAVAAVVLIAAFTGFWWIYTGSSLVLVGESMTSTELVELEDGTLVTLRPNTRIYRKGSKKSERSYSLSGEAFFDVVSDPDTPFSVEAGSGTVTVLGTRFNLSSYGEQTSVYLEEGRVRFSTPDERAVILEPGQSSRIVAGVLSDPEFTSEDTHTDWIQNTIVFNGTSPADVIAEIEQHYNISIDLDQLSDTEGLNGTLRLDSAEQTLEDLGLVLGGTFRETGDGVYTFISLD